LRFFQQLADKAGKGIIIRFHLVQMQIRERKQGSFRRRKKAGKQKKNEYYKYIKAQFEISIRL
jgi:hypothetical protein